VRLLVALAVAGTGAWRARRSIATRNAARVLPEPVGASRRVDSPRAIGGQPSSCARVGSPSAARNQLCTGGRKRSSGAGEEVGTSGYSRSSGARVTFYRMSDAPRASASRARASSPSSPSAGPAAFRSARPPPVSAPTPEYEFSEDHKERFSTLAVSMSFVGVCVTLLGLTSIVFAAGAGYAGFPGGALGLAIGAAVCIPFGWWTASAGRSLSALVRTRGRDVPLLMDALAQLRKLFWFAPVLIIAYAAAIAAVAWCTLLVGGKCFAW
jgi:hypothetical protein